MNKDKLKDFQTKHNLSDEDMRNLNRFENFRRYGGENPMSYLAMMEKQNVNGGKRLADMIWDDNFYGEYREVLGN